MDEAWEEFDNEKEEEEEEEKEVEESEVIETPFMETMRSGGLVSRFFNQYEQRAQFDMLDIKMQIWDKTQLINILRS